MGSEANTALLLIDLLAVILPDDQGKPRQTFAQPLELTAHSTLAAVAATCELAFSSP